MQETARDLGAALIHSNTVRATVYATLAARLASVPLVWHMRDFWLSEAEPATKWPDRMSKFILCRMAAVVLTNSRAVARHLPNSPKLSVLYNGIDLSHFDQAYTPPPTEPPPTEPPSVRPPVFHPKPRLLA